MNYYPQQQDQAEYQKQLQYQQLLQKQQQQEQNYQQLLINQQHQPQQLEDPYFNSVYVLTNRFDVPKYYQIECPIGTGGYGVVIRGIDLRTNERVAIKKVLRPFINYQETKQILREIKLLKAFKHENIVQLKNFLNPTPFEKFNEIYLVFELMESDLHQIITSGQQLSLEHKKFFMYQLLCGLKYIHSAKVFHRDLKPSNLLVNSDCELKVKLSSLIQYQRSVILDLHVQ